MAQALAGITILDFTQVLAGPMATQQLALLGADVIKIEQPETGDQTRGLMNDGQASAMSPSFMSCNLGKRSVTLDLKAPQARDIVIRLVQRADAVVENFRPGVMRRLGFDYASLRALKPELVYCSVSGYGQAGPKADIAAYDGAIQADSGMMSINGHPETGPTRTGYMPVDMATALNTAFALTAALYRRLATGEGQYVDVAMMDTAMVMLTPQVSNYLVNGAELGLIGNRSPTGQPTANVFATADGHINIVALRDPQVATLFAELGLSEHLTRPEFATGPARMAHYDAVVELITQQLRQRSTADWLTIMTNAGVPAAAIRGIPQVVDDTQFHGRNVFVTSPSTTAPNGTVRLVQAGYVASADGPAAPRPPPHLGEHTDEVLTELGFDPATIALLRKNRVV